MALIRVEAVRDDKSGLYFIEIYNPSDASAPSVTTEPRYMTAAAAENDVVAIIASGTNRAQKK